MNAPTVSSADALVQQAIDAWRAGSHDQARELCARVLASHPHHFDALHLSGILELSRNAEAARAWFERALAVREAPDPLVNLALTYGNTAPAQALLEHALAIDPQHVDALNNLGNLHSANGNQEMACALFERLLAMRPDHAATLFNFGTTLLKSGQPMRAIPLLRRAVELDPLATHAKTNLLNALVALHRHGEALVLMEAACALEPQSVELLVGYGSLLRDLGRDEDAYATLARAIEIEPNNAYAWNNLGNIFYDWNRIAEAHTAYLRAVELRPDFADAQANLGTALKSEGDVDAAIAAYRAALTLDPLSRGAGSNLAYMLAFATEDAAVIRGAAETYSECHEAALLAQPVTHANTPEPARRLRIGYVSPDFRNHCQSMFMLPLLSRHDHAAYEIFCYSTVPKPDEITTQLAAHADVWRDARDVDDAALAQQIRADGIDVLVDLTMHMAGTRRGIFAHRPAPVQVAWLAYPGTTGSAAIGWRLTDPWLDPLDTPGIDEQYTERSLRLPDTFWCYAPLEAPVEVGELPALSAGHITFGCLNNPCKLTDATFALWSGVFAALPDSRLVLMAPPGNGRVRLAERLAAHGVDASRVRFVEFQPREAYLRMWSQIDIALDTFPYNGHTTSLDAFWMGVPVPTRVGKSVASRAGLSLLANLGLPELAAHSDTDYTTIVTTLARDLPRLRAIRQGLRARMAASPLMDAERFARGMESAYRFMWRDWCDSVRTATPDQLVHTAAEHRASGRFDEAEAALHQAISLDAAHVDAWRQLGDLLRQQDRDAECETALRRVIELAPDDANAHNNLGGLLAQTKRHDEARALIERALALKPDFAEAWRNLGTLLMQTGDNEAATVALGRAVALDPGFAHSWVLLAGLLMQAGETAAAIDAMRHSVDADPADESAHADLAFSLQFITDDAAAIRAEAERFCVQHEAPWLAAPAHHANPADPARRLRIGYVSPDFRNHCQSLFTLPLLGNHDHEKFEIVCYASVDEPDAITQRIISCVDVWRDVNTLDDAALAEQIRADGIDILVDLTMHMARARRRVFALRPAPIQVAWLAYPGTTGSPAIGWRFTDPWLDPVGDDIDANYTERSLRLPDTFWCYAPLDDADRAAPVSALPALTAGHITFGCLNNPCKLTDVTLALWSRVFAALPTARLILLAATGTLRARLVTRLAAHGIDPARVSFVGYQKRLDYLQTYAQIDIALETFPYNGHTTSLDAFNMGVPVPTRSGRSAASRAGLSLLANLGLSELATQTDTGYVDTVTALAHDLPRLAALRAGLRARMAVSPLMDGARFARGVEAAYRTMWQAWCAQE